MKAIISIITAMLILFSDSQGQINLMKNDPPIEQDKTLSPYFLVKSDNPDVDQLPLYLTKADVKIAGVIADVTVTQVYKNTGKSPLEAIYVFPASTKAAVYGMTMTIGERILNIRKGFNVREGILVEDQKLNGRPLGNPPLKKGPIKGVTVDNEKLTGELFAITGWDRVTGGPTTEKMKELQIDELFS